MNQRISPRKTNSLKLLEIPRIRVEKRQPSQTLINEEHLLFAKNLRNEKKIGLREPESFPSKSIAGSKLDCKLGTSLEFS